MTPPFAADYPFLEVLWSMLIFVAFVMWIWIAITCFADIFRRHDMGGFAKVLWVIFLIIVPYLGVLAYLLVSHRGMAERNAAQAKRMDEAFDARVREAAAQQGNGAGGTATEIA